MAKNYVIDGGTGELDVGGNTLANRFDLPDKMAMNPFSEGHMPGAPEVFPMPNTPDLLREEGIQVGEQVRVPQNLGQRYNIGGLVRKDFLYGSDDVKKIKELRKKGRTSEDIGKLFKRSGSWVEQIVRKHKLPKQTIPLGGFSKGDFIRGAAERPSKWLIDYSRADLAKDLKAGKTLNEISEDLYAKHKFDYDKIPVRQQGKYKTTPVAHILSSLNSKIETKVTEGWNKEVLKENKALRNLADQNQAKYNRTVKNIKTDINNFISSNKAKYKKLYQTDTLAPKKFYKAILDMVEKKYPKFIKVSEGAIYGGITKGEKILPIFQDAKGGQYGHKLAITRVIDKAIGNVSNRKNVAWEKTYIDAVKKLLPLAQEQGLIDKTYTNRSGKKVKLTPERYQLYMRQTLTNPLAKIFGKNIIWSPEHMGGITRAGILNDPKALAHVTPMESGSLNKLKGVVSDKKLTGVIRNAAHRIDEPAFVRKQLVTANRLSKEAFDKYGVRQATYSYDAKNKRINTKYPKLTLGDSLLAKTKGAIHNFIANGSMKKPIFKQLPEKLQQGIKLINQGKNANKILSSHLDDIIPNWKGTKGLTFNNFAGAISLEGLPSGATQAIGKAASALGKGLKVLGVASLPLDTIPFAQQMERGLGTRSLDTGAMRWIEDLINAPKNIAQVFGGDLDYEERTFGRKYADKVAGEIGEEKITENIDQLFEGSEKIGDPMYDALGEYSFAARSDDRQKVKDKALTPFFEETETEEFELDPISKRVLGQPQLEFAGGGSVEPRIEYRDGTRMSPQPPKEKSFEEIIKELQIQYGIPDEEGFAVKDKLGRLGDIVDVRNYPYYGSKVGKGIMEAAEFSVRFPGATGQLIHDVATGPGWKQQGLDFIKNVSPGWGWSEKVGLDSLIDEQVGAMKERGSSDAPASLGGVLNLGADIAMPLGYVWGAAKFGKFIKALGQTPDKISDFNKRIIDHLDSTGQSKRDFMTLVGSVGAMGAIKAMGLDKIFNVGKVIKGADDMIPMVKGSYSTMPKWFPMFIQKINPKMIYEGDGMSTFTGTDDFLPGIKVEKNGDDYLIHGQNEYGQNWSVSYEGPRWLEIEPGQKPIYFKGEFEVVDEVPVGRRPEDVEFEPEVIREIDELLGGNGRSMEEFATGKEIEGLTKGEKQVDWAEGRAQQAMDEAAELEAGVFDEVN